MHRQVTSRSAHPGHAGAAPPSSSGFPVSRGFGRNPPLGFA
jgi:hypothetical protein